MMIDPSPASLATDFGRFGGQMAAIVFCWLLLTFASLAEAALVRLEVVRVRHLVAERGWLGQRLLELVENRQEVLSTLILLINLAIIAASAYTTEIVIRVTDGSERWMLVASFAMILFLLVFCEVTPKTYGVRRAEKVGLAIAPVLFVAHRALRPIGRVLHLVGMAIIRRVLIPVIGGEALAGLPMYSDQEVLDMVAEGQANGDIEQEEREMIAGVIEFADKVTREVMTPRTDMVWIAAGTSLAEAAQISERTGYSRLPVCVDDVDHVVGILYVKDMISALATGRPELTAEQVARKPVPMVPESRKSAEVLNLMQRKRLHMAIVIDEYGGTAGLVTIEDLLEEIFGEIRDEHDFEAEPVNQIDENTAVVDARVSVADVESLFGVELPQGQFDSIGGFVLDQLGHVPSAGESAAWRNLQWTVEAVSENRIQRVRIVRSPEMPDEEEQDEEVG